MTQNASNIRFMRAEPPHEMVEGKRRRQCTGRMKVRAVENWTRNAGVASLFRVVWIDREDARPAPRAGYRRSRVPGRGCPAAATADAICVSFFFKAWKKHDTARRRQLAAAVRLAVVVLRDSAGALALAFADGSAAAVVQLVCCEGAVAVQLAGL
ncbi:MAG TPA: hypothetical protein VLX44_22580 [Xanthobacteraceae bacterium]|nr:hypothetical protein [Xanthobacteraceae bacterium]